MAEVIHKAPEKIATGNAEAEMKLLADAASKAISEPDKTLVVDMADTAYISSAGIRALRTSMKSIRAAGGTFVLRNVSERVREIIDLTGIQAFVKIE